MQLKKKKIDDRQEEHITNIKNPWQLIGFLFVEAPVTLFFVLVLTLIIALSLTTRITFSIGNLKIQKQSIKIPFLESRAARINSTNN
jgi:penicillin-binding protein-related factor A (putative recombinase)